MDVKIYTMLSINERTHVPIIDCHTIDLLGSISMVENSAVNRRVVGSSPTFPAFKRVYGKAY